jgi:hypothetical protein
VIVYSLAVLFPGKALAVAWTPLSGFVAVVAASPIASALPHYIPRKPQKVVGRKEEKERF